MGNLNRYTKRPLQDSATIFFTPGGGDTGFYCASHRVSCKCQQPSGWKIHTFFRWKMPFAVFVVGSGVSENRAKILPGKSGLFGPDWSLFRAYRGLFGADWDRFLRTSQPRGGSRNSPGRAFLGPIGAFWAKPLFAKPPFGFPQNSPRP